MNRRRALYAAVACMAAAMVAGWFRPTPLETHAIGGHASAWNLPSQAQLERSSAKQFSEIAGVAWAGTGSDAAGNMNSEWTLLGLVGRSREPAILVRVGKDPLIKRFRAGDTLPDGSRLVGVEKTGIIVDRAGYESAFYLTAAVAGMGAFWWAFGVPRIEQVDLD